MLDCNNKNMHKTDSQQSVVIQGKKILVRKSVLVAHYKFIMLFFGVHVCRFMDFVMSFAWLLD